VLTRYRRDLPILVVDDDPVCASFCAHPGSGGYLWSKQRTDKSRWRSWTADCRVILLDLMMPELDGFGVVRTA
jgi:CheY-like chemotaxis protein